MTLLAIPARDKFDSARWINPVHVSYVALDGTTLTIWMLDDHPDNSHLEVTFDTVSQAQAFVKAISLHGTPSGVS